MEETMKRLFLTGVLIALAAALSGCGVIDFEDVDGTGNPVLTTLTTKGFMFTSEHFHAVGEPGACDFGGCVDNGTVYILGEDRLLSTPITMRSASGAPFSLFGFDGAQPFNDDAAAAAAGFPNASHIGVEGTFVGGGTETQFFALDDVGFKTFSFAWSNLESVIFVGLLPPAFGGWAIDNIQISDGAAAEQESSVELEPSVDGDPVAP
jgi:hypothetical protein